MKNHSQKLHFHLKPQQISVKTAHQADTRKSGITSPQSSDGRSQHRGGLVGRRIQPPASPHLAHPHPQAPSYTQQTDKPYQRVACLHLETISAYHTR